MAGTFAFPKSKAVQEQSKYSIIVERVTRSKMTNGNVELH